LNLAPGHNMKYFCILLRKQNISSVDCWGRHESGTSGNWQAEVWMEKLKWFIT